jgi:hypothetical protein
LSAGGLNRSVDGIRRTRGHLSGARGDLLRQSEGETKDANTRHAFTRRGAGCGRRRVVGRRSRQVARARDHRTSASKPASAGTQRNGNFVWVEKKGQPGHWERARADAGSAPKAASSGQQGAGKYVWVEKKGQPGHWERAQAEAGSGPTVNVRDHRTPAPEPVVHDKRRNAPVVHDKRKKAPDA